jgi:hypothetical protein
MEFDGVIAKSWVEQRGFALDGGTEGRTARERRRAHGPDAEPGYRVERTTAVRRAAPTEQELAFTALLYHDYRSLEQVT